MEEWWADRWQRSPSPEHWESPKGEICSALLCYASLSLFSPLPSPSVWLPFLACDLFCSLLMLSVALLRGLVDIRMDSVYTPPSSVASYSRRHGWECVCLCAPWVHERCVHVCVGSLRKRKDQQDKELAWRRAWPHSTFTRQFYYLSCWQQLSKHPGSKSLAWRKSSHYKCSL